MRSDEVDWVRVIEFQEWRGAAHVHALVGKTGYDARTLRAWTWEQFGWNKIYSYDASRGAKYYLCKYIVKDLQDIEFSESVNSRSKGGLRYGDEHSQLSLDLGRT